MTDTADYRVAKLDLSPGDIVVLKFDRVLKAEAYVRVRDQIEKMVQPGVRVMILDRDVDVSVLSAEEIARRVSS